MAWAIITIYTSKCAQMDPQQLLTTSKFYSRCKKCDIEKTLIGVGTTPLGARRLRMRLIISIFPSVVLMYAFFPREVMVNKDAKKFTGSSRPIFVLFGK